MSAKVSLILPVYNVEKYLSQCLDSIVAQTYQNIEVIMIDDGSKDASGNICDEYSTRDKRFIVVHQPNGGAANARNTGLDMCTGDYIMFVDSDDWLEDNTIECLIKTAQKQQCEIVQCQYMDEYIGKSEYHTYIEEERIVSSKTFVEDMLDKWEYLINCNKLYKASAVGSIRFLEGHCIDDEFFTYKVVLQSNRIALVKEYLYHYRQRRSSAMGSDKNKKQRLLDQMGFVTIRYPELCKAFPTLKGKLLEHLLNVLFLVIRDGAFDKEIYAKAKGKLVKYGLEAIVNKDVSVSAKKNILMYLLKNREKYIVVKNGVNKIQEQYYE